MDLPNALLRTAPIWVIMQQSSVISYWHFGTTYWSHLEGSKIQWFWVLDSWTLRVGPIGCPKTSVRNYHWSLRNKPRRAQLSATSRQKSETQMLCS